MFTANSGVHTLSEFQRDTARFLSLLEETGGPILLTIDGKAAVVVQDAQSYQKLLEVAERIETIQAVKEGLASVDRGEGKPLDEAFDQLEHDLQLDESR